MTCTSIFPLHGLLQSGPDTDNNTLFTTQAMYAMLCYALYCTKERARKPKSPIEEPLSLVERATTASCHQINLSTGTGADRTGEMVGGLPPPPTGSVQCRGDTPLFQALSGLQHLAETRRFKAWFLDQFGVLHDGKQPYPGAISALKKLASTGAKMVVISNSSRRASTTLDKLNSLGFDSSLFAGAITSGELTHQCLLRRDDDWFAALGKSCIHFTWSGRGVISLEGLGLQVVDGVQDADFVLAHGSEALGHSSGAACPMALDQLEKILELCVAKRIPMVVANPDFVTVEARDLLVMPGTLAAKYENLGGEVKWMGKPDKIIYKSAVAMAGADASDSIAVGDSLHHDIKGANAAGIQSAFITGGIHASELGLHSFGEVAELSSIQALASKYEAYPSYVLPSFAW